MNEADKPGVLRSSITVELSTKEAVALFNGRKKTEELNLIIGLSDFAQRVRDINNASHNNDPYADFFLLEIEYALKSAKEELIDSQDDLTKLSDSSLLQINQGSSIRPTTLETRFASVYANIALDLLKRADNLLLTLYALRHTGMFNRVDCNNQINNTKRLLRKTFLSANGYRFFGINRRDVEQQTAKYRQAHVAMKFTEELPADILDKTRRAEFAPNIVLDPNEIFRKPKKVNTQATAAAKDE
ncbi:FIG141694: hypothetical protein in PFGI-1-like cluster [hydrothermal vent metagenome]|uniref:Uncharacterized protein n=1 Tax=hydrothermal vent metagenome TaxID=652676 RepID=A0A1W1E5M0_9ZZZZ